MTRAANLAIFASNPPTVNSTAIAVGANVYMNATSHFVGNSTVNTTITQTTAAFNTNSTATALYVSSNGNVGIGTASPGQRLDLGGGSLTLYNSTGTQQVYLYRASATNYSSIGTDSSAGGITFTTGTSSPSERVRIDSSGNVAIGTASTSGGKFIVSATNAAVYFRLDESTSGYSLTQGMDDTGVYFKHDSASRGYRWITNTSSEAARIDAGGNVAIGTTTTTGGKLTVSGSTQVTSFGVGTAASGTSGEIRATNNITAYYTSDRRFKENIVAITNAVEKVKTISGVNFDWTQQYIDDHGGEDDYFLRKHDVGVIAQEIQTVIPEAVATREDGSLAVRYEKIIPLLIQSIKELTERLEVLESK